MRLDNDAMLSNAGTKPEKSSKISRGVKLLHYSRETLRKLLIS